MYIYKITNLINDKVYIGQTSKTIQERFNRHKQDALSNRLDTHLARAIKKYGIENFIIEEIDIANNQDELNLKEQYWIHYYDSIKKGYNETDSINKSGGNTYVGKTEEELEVIKEKIRKTKLGGKNPNARKVKCRNEKTGEEFHFDSLAEMQIFFNEPNHNFISRRCNYTIKSLYKNEWNIAYEENEYRKMTNRKNNARAVAIKVKNLETNEELDFPSYTAAEEYFHLSKGALGGKAYLYKDEKVFILRKIYQITKLS